jgi:hypothetical protein
VGEKRNRGGHNPALVDSCFWAIVAFSGVVSETTRQHLPPPISAAFVRIARHCDPQEVRNHPFDIPVSVLLQSDADQHTETISSGLTPHTVMGAPSFSVSAENVWVPVISRDAGLSSVCERQPPRFHYRLFSLIFQNKSSKK